MKKILLIVVILLAPSFAFGAGPHDGFWFVGDQILVAIEQQGNAFFGGLAHTDGVTIDGWALILGSVEGDIFTGTLLDFTLQPYGIGSFTFSGDIGMYRRTDLEGNLVYELPVRKLIFGSP